MKHVTQRKARRSVMSLVCSAGAAAAVLFGGAVSNASAAATLTPLGFLGAGTSGFTLSLARGVSANGSTVVGYSETASVGEAFRWTAGSGMVGLGFGDAFGNSGDSSTIVGRSGSEAFRWTSASGMVGLGDLPGGTRSQTARGNPTHCVTLERMTISNSMLSGNTADPFFGSGGGIYNDSSGTLTVANSSNITGNTSAELGADVYNLGVLRRDISSTIGVLDGNPAILI